MGNDGYKLREAFFLAYNSRNHTHYGLDGNPVIKYDGGIAPDGRKYTCKWDAWAELIKSYGLDINEYVMAVFQSEDVHSPNELAQLGRLDFYRKALDDGTDVLESWDAQERQLTTQVHIRMLSGDVKERAIAFVLHDEVIPVSPLVRYAVGKLNNVDVSEFKEDAYKQYQDHKVWYDRQCPERIPEEFKC